MTKVSRPKRQPIPIDRCHLYGIRSPHALAKRLGWSLPKLDQLAAYGGYRVYPHPKTGRMIQQPGDALQSIHRQIHKYLARVEVPGYLHSTVKGRSYVSNAKEHVGTGGLIKIDIHKFYKSVPQHRVMHFFRDRLNCATDVAGLLANLVCFEGALPTGGSASPIVSYYTYKSLFDEFKAIADRHGLVMTCYVDDITMSGSAASDGILQEVRHAIFKAGLRGHKACHYQAGQSKIVTGVVVRANGISLPFSRWKNIRDAAKAVQRCSDPSARLDLYPVLVSRLYEAAQIERRCYVQARYHHAQWRSLRSINKVISVSAGVARSSADAA